jgi:hypothetical protein
MYSLLLSAKEHSVWYCTLLLILRTVAILSSKVVIERACMESSLLLFLVYDLDYRVHGSIWDSFFLFQHSTVPGLSPQHHYVTLRFKVLGSDRFLLGFFRGYNFRLDWLFVYALPIRTRKELQPKLYYAYCLSAKAQDIQRTDDGHNISYVMNGKRL